MLFGLFFFFIRIIFGIYVTIELWCVFVFRDYYKYSTNIDGIPNYIWISILIINFLFHILNFYWFYVIIKGGIKMFKKVDANKNK